MNVFYKDNIFTLKLSRDEVSVISAVLNTANNRCFEERDSDGCWYSNDDFVLLLSDDERQTLSNLCKQI